MKQNKIKTIEMVRQIRDKQYEQTKDMSTAEKIAFYRERSNTLLAQLQTIVDAKRKERALLAAST